MIIQWKWQIDSRDYIWQNAWRNMDVVLWHCTGGSDQGYPQEKEMQKGKMVFWWSLTNSWEKRGVKGKGEKERYTHLNAEFQRIARRDKKAFLSDQCKEMRKTTEWERLEISSRKLEIPKKHFMQRWAQKWNNMDLTEAEDIKKRCQEYTEELYKKDLHDPITTMWSLI